jgi:hypothetical protein
VSDFKFSPAEVTAQTVVQVDAKPKQSRIVQSQTDAERIAAARARGIARLMAGDFLPQAMRPKPTYYVDFAGPQSSMYDCDHLLFLLYFLEDPKFRAVWFHSEGRYNTLSGIFTQGEFQISIDGLKQAVSERITELGLSHVLIEEWMATPKSWQEDQQLYALSFNERMTQFKAA